MKNNVKQEIKVIEAELMALSINNPACIFDVIALNDEIKDWKKGGLQSLWDLQFRVKYYHSNSDHKEVRSIVNRIMNLNNINLCQR
jgi:hypothetical protein